MSWSPQGSLRADVLGIVSKSVWPFVICAAGIPLLIVRHPHQSLLFLTDFSLALPLSRVLGFAKAVSPSLYHQGTYSNSH